MQKHINFTKAGLDTLSPIDRPYEVHDTKLPGLCLRVNSGGSKTYILLRKIAGSAERIKIGRYPDISIETARKQATILNGKIANGYRPREFNIARKSELLFRELFHLYYTQHSLLHTKRPKEYKELVDLHLIPRIGNLRIGDIRFEKMRAIHAEIGEINGKYQANRVISFANAIFNFGLKEREYKGENPCFGIKKFKVKSRDRFFTEKELLAFFEALKEEDEIYKDFFTLSLFIGARKSTMLGMKFNDLNFEINRWRVAEDETKNSEVNIHMLSDEAVWILKKRYDANKASIKPSAYVFPGEAASGHLENPKKAFKRVKKRMGVDDIRIHDLRRTLGSYMAINGASMPIIGKALNHKSQVSTEIYARLSQVPVFNAINHATKHMVNKLTERHEYYFIHFYKTSLRVTYS